MFYKAGEAAAFAKAPSSRRPWNSCAASRSRTACSGRTRKSKDAVGIAFPDGSTLGNAKNVKLRFDATYMQLAADGKL